MTPHSNMPPQNMMKYNIPQSMPPPIGSLPNNTGSSLPPSSSTSGQVGMLPTTGMQRPMHPLGQVPYPFHQPPKPQKPPSAN